MAGLGDLNMQNPLWATFLFYAGVLGLKTVIMSVWTARHRIANKVFANPEDASGLKGKVKLDHPDVERVRRAHLNDLENVLPFLILCPLYLSTGPSVWLATLLIRAFAAARVLHTIVYINVVPQPSRVSCFIVGFNINMYLAFQILRAGMQHVPQPSRGLCFAVGFGINMYLAAQLVMKTMQQPEQPEPSRQPEQPEQPEPSRQPERAEQPEPSSATSSVAQQGGC